MTPYFFQFKFHHQVRWAFLLHRHFLSISFLFSLSHFWFIYLFIFIYLWNLSNIYYYIIMQKFPLLITSSFQFHSHHLFIYFHLLDYRGQLESSCMNGLYGFLKIMNDDGCWCVIFSVSPSSSIILFQIGLFHQYIFFLPFRKIMP